MSLTCSSSQITVRSCSRPTSTPTKSGFLQSKRSVCHGLASGYSHEAMRSYPRNAVLSSAALDLDSFVKTSSFPQARPLKLEEMGPALLILGATQGGVAFTA